MGIRASSLGTASAHGSSGAGARSKKRGGYGVAGQGSVLVQNPGAATGSGRGPPLQVLGLTAGLEDGAPAQQPGVAAGSQADDSLASVPRWHP